MTPTATVTLDFTTAQTVGQLAFTNGVQATLNNDGPRTLNIGAVPPAVGLQAGAGVKVQIVGTQSAAALKVQLAPNVKASIAGRVELSGLGSTGSGHQLLSNTPGALEFLSGSYLLGGSKFTGFPFGELSAGAGSAVFRSGATFEQFSGGTAFGGKTWSMATFDPGSTFVFSATSGTLGVSNRTFGYILINTNRTSPIATFAAGTLKIANDLTITAGTHPFNVQSIELLGNIVLNGGNMTLPAVDTNNGNAPLASTLNVIGSAAQSIAGTGTITLGPNVSLALNNAAGLTLQRPLQINGTLTLTQGLLTTSAANSLTLGPLATTSGGSSTSFVNGPLSRVLATANTATDLFFPIGSGTAYRPLTLRAEQTDATATTYTAQQFNQAPTARAMPTAAGSLQRVSAVRYFNATNGGAANFRQGAITLSYDIDDKVDAPAKLRIAKSDNAGNWLDLGGMGSGAPTGSIASTVPFTSFSDFVLASTEANAGPGNNPLPVTLTGFTARQQAAGVRLDWATASERNNSRFEVQRSADGLAFARVATMPGQGTSGTAHAYTWLDAEAAAGGARYYRLYQVNADGTGAYSPVAVVPPGGPTAAVYPNPAHEQISFSAVAGGTYRVLDLLGQPLLAGPAAPGLNTLQLGALATGAYYLEVSGAGPRARYRFFKR